jgi:hypothetical protein
LGSSLKVSHFYHGVSQVKRQIAILKKSAIEFITAEWFFINTALPPLHDAATLK